MGTTSNPLNSGNVAAITNNRDTARSQSFTYDTLNRIGGMSSPGETCTGFSWTIDIWANRTDQSGTGGTCGNSHMTVNTLNRIADPNYPYDAAGNLTGVPGATSYQYDAENRMVSMNLGGASYVYDANGRRVRKVASGTTTDYFYDLGGNVAAERVGVTWTKGYVYVGSRLLVQYDNTVSPTTTFFAHQDHLSSTRLMTKMNQGTQECTDYLPYGEQQTGVCTSSGSVTTTHKFTGKERDTESGLDNFGARYYSSALGRFATPDWASKPTAVPYATFGNPQSLNLYSYVKDNPLSATDLDGHCSSPSVGTGQVGICVDLYIAAKVLPKAVPLGVAFGDNRGPAPNDPKATYRVELQFVVDPANKSVNKVKDDPGVSVANVAGITVARKGQSNTMVSNPTASSDGTTHFNVSNTAVNGLSALPFAPKDTIQTDLNFAVTSDGKVGLDPGGMRTAYPSIEIYSYSPAGTTTTILQQKESRNLDDLKRKDQAVPAVKPQ